MKNSSRFTFFNPMPQEVHETFMKQSFLRLDSSMKARFNLSRIGVVMISFIVSVMIPLIATGALAKSAWVGSAAPKFELKNQLGQVIKLEDRKTKGYTVIYFYPKAGTPGCTKQACAFRDSIKKITNLNAVVYGISTDSVKDLKKFHDEHKLLFDLLSDESGSVSKDYKVLMRLITMSSRQTFVLDPSLTIIEHFEDVDPALDAANVAKVIEQHMASFKSK